MVKNLNTRIKEIKRLGREMISLSYPKVTTEEDDILTPLKMNPLTVDGYEIVVHYNISEFDEYFSETIQIFGSYEPFLPFNLICKVAKKFLGTKHLNFVEVIKDGKKIYCWTTNLNKKGKAIASNVKSRNCTFEGLNYCHIDKGQVRFI